MILRSIGGKSVISMGTLNSKLWIIGLTNFEFLKAVKNVMFVLIHREIGYIPSNYVKEKELLGLQQYE